MINAAILGLGRWGTVLVGAVHGASEKIAFRRAVVRQPESYAAFAAAHDLSLGTDYGAVLADPAIDAVVLATPHSQHADQVIRAAAAGKHVLCEKPFTQRLADAERAAAACAAAGVVLAIGFQRRYLDCYAALKARLDAGDLGTIEHLEANQSAPAGLRMTPEHWRAQPGEMRAGAMGGHGIHMIDTMIGLAGRIARVHAWSRRHALAIEMDDTTALLLEFAAGPTAYLGTSLATAPQHRLTIYGSGGWAEMADEATVQFRPVGGTAETVAAPTAHVERAELEGFADAITGAAPFAISVDEALHGQAVFEAIAESIEHATTVTLA